MRKRCILPWYNRNQPDLAGDRQGEYRCWCDILVLCAWNDRVPDGNHRGKGRRKESEDEIWGRWGILRGEEENILYGWLESREIGSFYLLDNVMHADYIINHIGSHRKIRN